MTKNEKSRLSVMLGYVVLIISGALGGFSVVSWLTVIEVQLAALLVVLAYNWYLTWR